jgi:hypothetical protein
VFLKCFERGLLIPTTGDTIALSPARSSNPNTSIELFGAVVPALKE